MGIGIVLTLLAIEIMLLVGGLMGWFDRRRVVPYVRIGVLLVFLLMAITGVVEWAPRYYTLTVWLLALGAWGVRSLYREPSPQRVGPMIATGVVAGVVTFLAAFPLLIFPEYTPLDPTGDFEVVTATYTVTDESRVDPFSKSGHDRWLTFGVWYPDATGTTFPLVVFSHGSIGIRESNLSMFEELASHGYVVVSIDHTGHALHATDRTGHRAWVDGGYLGELRRENAREDPDQSLEYYRKWMEVRVGDIGAVLDHILENAGSDPVFGMVDGDRVGLVGHSLGGAAVIGVGRERGDIDAVIALEAPYMTEIVRVENGRFVWNPDPYPVPVLNVYSDTAWGHLEEWPQYGRNYELLDDPAAHNIRIEGVGHLHLTDLSLSSPLLTRLLNGHPSPGDATEALQLLNSYALSFFDSSLKGGGTPARELVP